MAKASLQPVATPAYSVVQSTPHQVLVCKGCKRTEHHRRPGVSMIANLRAAIVAKWYGNPTSEEISRSSSTMRPCLADRKVRE